MPDSESMSVPKICLIKLHCPQVQCWVLGAQNCTFDRLHLEERLKGYRDIKAIGGTCHHIWSLTEGMKDKLRRMLLPQPGLDNC